MQTIKNAITSPIYKIRIQFLEYTFEDLANPSKFQNEQLEKYNLSRAATTAIQKLKIYKFGNLLELDVERAGIVFKLELRQNFPEIGELSQAKLAIRFKIVS